MNDIAIRFDHVGKLYKLGLVGTGTLSHDLNRWWKTSCSPPGRPLSEDRRDQ